MMLTTTTTMMLKTRNGTAATTLALALALTPLASSCTFGSDDDGAEVTIAVTQSALTDAQRDEIELIEVTASHPALSTPRSNWLGGSRLREGSAVRFRGLPASRNSDELVRFTAVAQARGRKPIWYAAQEQLLRPGTNSLRLAMQRADYQLIPADAQLASPGADRDLTVEALLAGEPASASNLANLDFAWQQVSGDEVTLASGENPREAKVDVPEDYAGEAAVFEVTAKLKAANDDPRFAFKARTTLFFAGTASVTINSLTEGQTLTAADDQDSSTPNAVDVTVSGTTGLSTEGIPVTVYLNDATTPAGSAVTNPDGSFDVEAIALTTGAQKVTVDIGPGFAKGSVNVLVDVGSERLTVNILEPAADSPDLPADINPNTAGLQLNVRARVTPVPSVIRQALLVINGARSGTAPINDSDGENAGLINFGEVTLPDGASTYTIAVFVGAASDSVTLGRPALEARFSQTGGGPLGNIFGLNVDADGDLANGIQTEVIVTPRGLPVGTVIAVTGADATQNIRAADPGAELTFDINLLANTTEVVASATIPGGATVEPVTLVAIPDLLPPGIEALITPETVGTVLNLANDLAQDVIPNTPELDLNIGANIIELNPGQLIVRIAGDETPPVTAPRDEGGALWVVPNVEFPQGDIVYQLEMTDLAGNTYQAKKAFNHPRRSRPLHRRRHPARPAHLQHHPPQQAPRHRPTHLHRHQRRCRRHRKWPRPQIPCRIHTPRRHRQPRHRRPAAHHATRDHHGRQPANRRPRRTPARHDLPRPLRRHRHQQQRLQCQRQQPRPARLHRRAPRPLTRRRRQHQLGTSRHQRRRHRLRRRWTLRPLHRRTRLDRNRRRSRRTRLDSRCPRRRAGQRHLRCRAGRHRRRRRMGTRRLSLHPRRRKCETRLGHRQQHRLRKLRHPAPRDHRQSARPHHHLRGRRQSLRLRHALHRSRRLRRHRTRPRRRSRCATPRHPRRRTGQRLRLPSRHRL